MKIILSTKHFFIFQFHPHDARWRLRITLKKIERVANPGRCLATVFVYNDKMRRLSQPRGLLSCRKDGYRLMSDKSKNRQTLRLVKQKLDKMIAVTGLERWALT
jgi:hypothetical protein